MDSTDDARPMAARLEPAAVLRAEALPRWLRVAWLTLLVVAMAAWLGSYPLMQPDEGRNAEVAREMAASGDFIVPRLNGLPYVDKPVLHFAAAGASMRAFGANELGARFPSLLFTVLTAAMVAWFGRRVWNADVGWAAAAMTLSAPLAVAMSRVVILDSLLAMLVTGSLIAAYLAIEGRAAERQGGTPGASSTPWRRWAFLSWSCVGLGILTKGPVALLLPLLVGIPYAVHRKALRAALYPPAIVLMCLIVAPWVALMSQALPDYVHYVAVTETWNRITTDKLRRTQPFWYFVPVLIFGTFPWVCMAVGELWRRRRAAMRVPDSRLRFLLLWIVLPFLFFSLSRSKLPHYMLPLVPAVALLAAAGVCARREADVPGRSLASAVFVLLGIALIGAALFAARATRVDPATLEAARLLAALLGLAAAAAGVTGLLARPRGTALVLILSLPMAVAGLASGPLLEAVGHYRSAEGLARAIQAQGVGGERVVGVGAFPTSLPFYLGRPIELASRAGNELTSNYVRAEYAALKSAPGSTLHGEDWWRTALAECATPTVFVIETDDAAAAAELRASGLKELAADRKYAAYGPCRPQSRDPD